MGTTALSADTLFEGVREATFCGRPALLFCDGEDAFSCCADEGESLAEFLRVVAHLLPESGRGGWR